MVSSTVRWSWSLPIRSGGPTGSPRATRYSANSGETSIANSCGPHAAKWIAPAFHRAVPVLFRRMETDFSQPDEGIFNPFERSCRSMRSTRRRFPRSPRNSASGDFGRSGGRGPEEPVRVPDGHVDPCGGKSGRQKIAWGRGRRPFPTDGCPRPQNRSGHDGSRRRTPEWKRVQQQLGNHARIVGRSSTYWCPLRCVVDVRARA